MESKDVEFCRIAAHNVVDGFVIIKNQQARDVIKLCIHIEEQNNIIRRLENKIKELSETKENHKDNFSNIFGGDNPFKF